MEKLFRSPIVIVVCFGLLVVSCGKDAPAEVNAKAIADGYALQVKADSLDAAGARDSAFTKYVAAKEFYLRANDSVRLSYVLYKMADIQYEFNDFLEVQKDATEALKYNTAQADSEYEASTRNLLGRTYTQLEEYDKAIGYFNEATRLTKDTASAIVFRNNIADAYINQGRFARAENVLRKINLNATTDTILNARILDNLGFAVAKQKNVEGFVLMHEAQKLREMTGDDFGNVTSLLHLADAYHAVKMDVALRYADQADKLAGKTQSAHDRLLALKFLTLNSADNAKYVSRYIALSDSLKLADNRAKSRFADTKYNFKKERAQRLETELDRARLEKNRAYWIAASAFVLSALSVSIFLIVRRNKRNRWRATNEAQIHFSNRLHDEVANSLHQSIVFAETQDLSNPAIRETHLDNLEELYRQARSLSREHAWTKDPEQFAQRLRELIGAYSVKQHVVVQGLDLFPWKQLDERKRFALFSVVQELLVNMDKHSGCTHASFKFSKESKKGTIEYNDNGKGSSDAATKNGLAIMENRIGEIKGTATFGLTSGKGFRVRIEFPI